MSLKDAISHAAQKRILFREENGVLRFHAPLGAMDDTTKAKIKEYRSSIMALVHPYSPRWCLVAPATINQASLVFIQNLSPLTSAYNVAVSFRLCGPLNRTAFESSCNLLYRNHSQLRVSFRAGYETGREEQLICQVVTDWEKAPICYDEREFPDDEQLRSALVSDYSTQFDIEQGPLVRWTVFDHSSESPVVLMTMHHAITDAWSIRILMKELFTSYSCALQNLNNALDTTSDNPYTYIDFTLHQHAQLADNIFREHIATFCKLLRHNISPLVLPTDFPRPATFELRGSSLPFVIAADNYKKMLSIAQHYNVSINSLLFTAYALLLHDETGQKNFTIGMPVANRTNPLFSDSTGYFVNTLAIPVDISTAAVQADLLQLIHATLAQSAQFQDIPFPALVGHLNPPRDSSRAPVFQVLFNFISRSLLGVAGDFFYEGSSEDTPRLMEGVEVRPFPIPQQEGQYDLTLEIIERNGYASGQLKYSTALFTKSSARRFLQLYLQILDSLIDNPSGRIAGKKAPYEPKKNVIAVAATFTADLLADSLDFWINRLGLESESKFAPYGQILQQFLDPTSLFRTNNNGYNVILIRLDDLCDTIGDNESLEEILSTRCNEILSTVTVATSSMQAVFLIFFCPSTPYRMENPETKSIFNRIELLYTGLFNDLPGVYATMSDTILSWYPVGHYHDQLRLENGHIPYTEEFHTALSTAIIRRVFVIRQKPIKVISIDCDNTLWSGVAAEEGPNGITVTDYHRDFQKLLSSQLDAGRLLTLVSKNREEDVDAVFSENRSMFLVTNAIYSRRINWSPKSDNIRSLASEIGVGLDGFLFIDDNPVECTEVSSALPKVLTMKFPAISAEIPTFLSGLWMLDNPKTTYEDLQRSDYYNIEKQRNNMKIQTTSFSDFLNKLELKVTFEELNAHNGERLSQLTYRTNQFNLSNNKFSYQELCQLQGNGNDVLAVTVKDRFGEYGIVGMIAYRFEGSNATVEMFLLSCRVLGRGVEYQMINKLVEIAASNKLSGIRLRFTTTDRNRPAMDFIENICKQHSCAKREDSLVFIPLFDIPQFSAITAENELIITKPTKSADLETLIMDQSSQDILNRNRYYRDIAENLSSLEHIRAAVTIYMQSKQMSSVIPVKTAPGAYPFETEIAEIWKKILRINDIDTNVNFFDLGGKSLQLPQVIADLEMTFGVKLILIDLFIYTTVKTLAEYIHNRSSQVKPEKPIVSNSIDKMLTGMQALRQRQQRSRTH